MPRVAPAPGRLWREIRPPSASIRSLSLSQARPVTEVRAAPPVVANPDLQDTIMGGRHLGRGGISVLGDVGQRLGHCVVGGDLDRLGKLPLDLDIQGDGDGRAAGQRSERRPQPARGEPSRVQATRDLPRFLKHASHPGQRAFQLLGPVRGLPAAPPPAPLSCRPRVTSRCRAPSCRLRSIRPAGGIADGHNPRPGNGELGLCLCVDDRGTEQFGESGQLLLGPGRHPGAGRYPDDATTCPRR
jgi:hypothetical protein